MWFSLTFPVCSKFPDFSLTGKCCPIFPGFPVRVGTLQRKSESPPFPCSQNSRVFPVFLNQISRSSSSGLLNCSSIFNKKLQNSSIFRMYGHFSKFAKFPRLSGNPEMIVAARPDSPSKTLVTFLEQVLRLNDL